MSTLEFLLVAHVVAGFTALGSALAATVAKTVDGSHRWHVVSGRLFAVAIAVVVGTAIPLAIAGGSIFLLLVGVFSGYMAATGWRLARNRRGTPTSLDWALVATMILAAAGMLVYGATSLREGGLVALVFGVIGAALALSDVRSFRTGGSTGPARIANHLIRMLGASIATLTAFTVTNVDVLPPLLKWLGPTVVITPVIVWWSRRIRAGFRPRGMDA